MTKTLKHTPETIQVSPLDMERLNEHFNQSFHKDSKRPTNITYHAHGTLALMRQPKLCIIDDEFVGDDIDDKVTFSIYEKEELGNGHFTMNCLPTWEVTLSLADLEPYLKPSVSLAEFTRERRGYNSRIIGNEREWMTYLNQRSKCQS